MNSTMDIVILYKMVRSLHAVERLCSPIRVMSRDVEASAVCFIILEPLS